jgi:hypothetical protein
MFLEVIKQIQCVTYIKLRTLENESLVRRSEMKKLTFARDQYQKYKRMRIKIKMIIRVDY